MLVLDPTKSLKPEEIAEICNHPVIISAARSIFENPELAVEVEAIETQIIDIIHEEKVATAIMALLDALQMLIANVIEYSKNDLKETMRLWQ